MGESSTMGAAVASGGAPCAPEGALRDCHTTLGSHNGVLSCFQGKQACIAGVWGPCEGAGTVTGKILATTLRSPATAGVRLDSLSAPATCTTNPCDPTCQVYNETPDAGIVPSGTTTVVAITGGALASSNVPRGFQTKGNDPGSVCSQCTPGSTATACQQACQFDMTCSTDGTNGCTAFAPLASGACMGIDLTVPVACANPDGTEELAVCNRGTLSAPPGVNCYLYPGNSPQYPSANPGLGTLIMTTQTTITPGACESQAVAASSLPSNGTASMMCNPPNVVTTAATAGPNFPGAVVVQGSWVNPNSTFATDGVDATLSLAANAQANTFSSASQNVGWTNANNAFGVAADGVYATAAVTSPSTSTSVTGQPTANSAVSGTWNNPTYAYSSTDSNASATTTLSLPSTATVPSSGELPATTTSGAACNGSTSADCSWTTGAFNDARGAVGAADGVFTGAALNKGDDAVAFLGGYGFTGANAVPSNAIVTQVTATATWRQSAADTRYTAGVAIYAGNGASMVGTECTSSALSPTTNIATCTVAAWQLQAAGFSVSDLTSAKLVRIHGSHAASGSATAYAIQVDSVTVHAQYQVPSAASILYSGFGLNVSGSIPSSATINSLAVTVNLRASASNAFAAVSFQAYKNAYATPIGSAPTTVANPASTFTGYTSTPSTIGLTPADLTNGNFGVLVSASAATAAWTLSVDYVQVVVTYSDDSGSNQTIALNGFGFDNTIPAGANIESVTTEVDWKVDTSSATETLGIEAVAGGTVLGSELTTPTSGPPTTATIARYAVTSGVTASQLYDANNFRVKLRATSAGGSNFTAFVDYVKVTVVWSATLTSTMTLGTFAFGAIPSSATITGLTLATKWSVSAANTTAQLGVEAFTGTAPIGAEATTPSGTSPPTSDTVFTANVPVTGLTPSDFANGTFTVNVRGSRASGSAPLTANVDSVTATVTYTTTTNLQTPECNYNNDWTVAKLSPALPCQNVTTTAYVPKTYTQSYVSSCPAGTHTQWAFLAYDTTTPSNASGGTSVTFQVQTTPLLTDGGAGTPSRWVTVGSTPTAGDPSLCPMSGPSPCPKDLYAALGGLPAATNENLALQVTLSPAPDGRAAPSLNSWQISYSCPASE